MAFGLAIVPHAAPRDYLTAILTLIKNSYTETRNPKPNTLKPKPETRNRAGCVWTSNRAARGTPRLSHSNSHLNPIVSNRNPETRNPKPETRQVAFGLAIVPHAPPRDYLTATLS